jgi:hypothetical protein
MEQRKVTVECRWTLFAENPFAIQARSTKEESIKTASMYIAPRTPSPTPMTIDCFAK